LFVKRGSVIPCAGRIQAAEFLYDEPLCLDVYPACEFGGELYIDDGETLDHHDGKYSLIAIHSTANKGKVSISIEKKAGLLSPPLYRWKEIQVRIARYTESFSRVQIAVNNRELKMESYTVEKDWITIHCGTDVFPITIDCVENE
jgi:alpha-glucosidase (family GH31 glycosyl hydrolase)